MSEILHFDPVSHTYTLGNRILPSVTGVIRAVGLMGEWGQDPEEVMLFFQLGRFVHEAAHLLDSGNYDHESGENQPWKPHLEQYQRFKADTGFEVLESELSLYHPQLFYAGTLDKIGMLNNCRVILDLKTGARMPWHDIQVAAYANVYRAESIAKCFQLYLTPFNYYLREVSGLYAAFQVFLAALSIYRWKEEHNG